MDIEEAQDWIFTFGSAHAHPNGFVRIFGTWSSAREEIVRRQGLAWSFQYKNEEEAGVTKYGLQEVHAE